jgi:hypothetical protein
MGLSDFRYANSGFRSWSVSTAASNRGIGGRIAPPRPKCFPVRVVWMNCCAVQPRRPVTSEVKFAAKLMPHGPAHAVKSLVCYRTPLRRSDYAPRYCWQWRIGRVARQQSGLIELRTFRSHDLWCVAVVTLAELYQVLASTNRPARELSVRDLRKRHTNKNSKREAAFNGMRAPNYNARCVGTRRAPTIAPVC